MMRASAGVPQVRPVKGPTWDIKKAGTQKTPAFYVNNTTFSTTLFSDRAAPVTEQRIVIKYIEYIKHG